VSPFFCELNIVMLQTHHPNSKHKNKSLDWFPTDTQELFNENYHTRRQELEDNGWLDRKIKYQFNDLGFRKQLKKDFEKDILFLGCSYTFGIGINYEDSFTNIVADALGMNNINWAVPGSSNDTAFRLCQQYMQKKMPSTVILNSPSPYRLELFSEWDGKHQSHNILSLQRCGEPILRSTNFECPIEFFDEKVSQLNREKNILAIEMLCVRNKIKFLNVNTEDMIIEDLGRDLAHPGVKSNQKFAEIILKSLSR
jgi:hypothetical protein